MVLHDIISINKQVRNGELENFFIVLEVYGSSTVSPTNSLESVQDTLSVRRTETLMKLNQITEATRVTISTLSNLSFGFLQRNMERDISLWDL